MDLNNYLTYDGVTSASLDAYISGEGSFNAPERVYDMQAVAGRNGMLAIDGNRYENIEVSYPAFIFKQGGTDFEQAIANLRSAFLSRTGYKRLADTYHPDEFRMAIYRSGLEVAPVHINRAGQFTLVFDCKPQRFLVSGETPITLTQTGTINNPTPFPAAPLLEVTGGGTIEFGGVTITVGGSNHTVIDCEMMEAYDGTTSKNGDITLEPNTFPKLQAGANNIVMSSGITQLIITPRWWRL